MMHPDELVVTTDTVRQLVDEQFPRWAGLPVWRVRDAGTVNAVFRLGEDLSVRLPLRNDGPGRVTAWLLAETNAATELARECPFPAPVPVATGEPGHGFPLPWAVQTWVPGTPATVADPATFTTFAEGLVTLLTRLRAVDTRGRRFSGTGRGGRLQDHDAWVEECLQRSDGLVDVAGARRLWARLRRVPRIGGDVMCHGDLVPGNVLVREGRLVGVLDGGGFGPADRSLDLVGAWHLLDVDPRDGVRVGLGCSDDEWMRGMAWALVQALGLVWYYQQSHHVMARTGRRTIARLLQAAEQSPSLSS